MTQEEKAKAYDEAIEKARNLHDNYDVNSTLIDIKEELEHIFPKLRESEDERIRKAISIYLDWLDGRKDCAPKGEYSIRDMIAWLEKQGQSHWSEEDEKIRQTIINEFEQCSEWCCSNGLTKEDCINWLNRQKYFEWSDEDNENMNSLCVLLDQMVSINAIGNEHSIEYKNWLKSLKDRVQPQNNIVTDKELAQAKKEAYNETLDKIEYHSGEPTFDDGWNAAIWYLKKRNIQPQPKREWKQENREELTEFENAMMHIGGSFFGENAGLAPNDTDTIKEQAELLLELAPKTEWSEEDERIYQSIIDDTVQENQLDSKQIDWLKSIKSRVQPKTEWSEEDEEMYQNIHECLKNGWKKLPTDLLKCESWFESIKQRIEEES